MAMATLSTATSLKQTLPSDNNTININNLHDVSFSSYLSNSDQSFVRKLAESSRNLAPDVQENGRKKEDNNNGEIGVFSAEKYFSGVTEVDRSPRISKFKYNRPKEQSKLNQPSTTTTTTTPSVHSESSSNSQITLLQPKSHKKTYTTERKTRKGFLAGLGCNCMCSDADSIDVADEDLDETSFQKGATFLQTKKVPQEIPLSVSRDLEKQRKSLEVFGSPIQDKKTGPSMLSKTEHTPALQNKDCDGSSSGSSDLFEIESVPRTCYAPSEASIEWSIVTASAADFSVMSDYEEISTKTAAAVGKTPRWRSSISLGCNNSNAVSIADRIANDKPILDRRIRQVSDSYMPAVRFPPENKVMEFDSTPRQHTFSKISLPRSQAPQIFYIH